MNYCVGIPYSLYMWEEEGRHPVLIQCALNCLSDNSTPQEGFQPRFTPHLSLLVAYDTATVFHGPALTLDVLLFRSFSFSGTSDSLSHSPKCTQIK